MATNITKEEQQTRNAFYAMVQSVKNITTPTILWITIIADILLLIFFLQDFMKRNPQYRKPYYIILVIGYGMHLWDQIFSNYIDPLFSGYQYDKNIQERNGYYWKLQYFHAYGAFHYFYFNIFYSFWNATQVVNKFTALWLPLKHAKIWESNFKKVVLLMLVAPVMSSFYTFANLNCIDPDYYYFAGTAITSECLNRGEVGGALGAIFTYFLTLFLIILIIIYHRKTISSFSPQIAKIEKRLMFQALTSLILYGIVRALDIAANSLCRLFGKCAQFRLDFYYFATFQYFFRLTLSYMPYLFDVLLLIVISNLFRKDFLNFYTFGFYQKYFDKTLFTKTATIVPASVPMPKA